MFSMSLTRRTLLAGAATLLAGIRLPSSGWAAIAGVPSNGDEIAFDVLNGNSVIGEHRMAFTHQGGGGLDVVNHIDVAVSFAGIRLFFYRHSSTETYQDGRLIRFVGETNDDGDKFKVDGEAVDGAFRSVSDKGPVMAPADILVASYWNPAIMTRKILLDPQKGRIREQVVEGSEPRTMTVLGATRQVTLYRVEGIADGSIFYDMQGEWVGAILVRRGTDVIYRRRV